ncbi:MAG: hypothetical protein WC635_07970 [Bacteriovorax sp.]|jgi:phenylalanine-4-hydroxylase
MRNVLIFIILLFVITGCSTSPIGRRDIASTGQSCVDIASTFFSKEVDATPASFAASGFEPATGQQTLTLSSGIQVEGKFTSLKKVNDKGEIFYYGTQGPTQLRHEGKVIPGQDAKQHPQGFSSPLGNLKVTDKPLEDLSTSELKGLGIEVGQEVTIEFRSGVIVQGKLKNIVNKNGKNIIFTFENETTEVMAPDGSLLFERSWGIYDMAIGKMFISNGGEKIPGHVISTYKRKLFNKTRQLDTIKDFKERGIEYIYDQLKSKGFRPVVLNEMVSTEELWKKVIVTNSKKGYYGIPIDIGEFAKDHGEYSHALQYYTLTKDMSESELNEFKSIFRRMEMSSTSFDEMWTKFFEAPGASTPDTPGFWRKLMNSN